MHRRRSRPHRCGSRACVQVHRGSAIELRAGTRDGDAHRTSRPRAIIANLSVMQYERITVPKDGQRITLNPDASLNVPDHPIIAFIEGDGIGIDITPVMLNVVNAAVAKAYGTKRKIAWVEVFAGDKAAKLYGTGFPDETLTAL